MHVHIYGETHSAIGVWFTRCNYYPYWLRFDRYCPKSTAMGSVDCGLEVWLQTLMYINGDVTYILFVNLICVIACGCTVRL